MIRAKSVAPMNKKNLKISEKQLIQQNTDEQASLDMSTQKSPNREKAENSVNFIRHLNKSKSG